VKKIKIKTEGMEERSTEEKELRCRELHAGKAGFMVGVEERDIYLLPSLPNYGR